MSQNKSIHTLSIILVTLLFFSCKEKKETLPNEKSINSKPEFKLIAEVSNLPHCESVAFDSKRNVLYVSVQSEDNPNDGSIAKLSLNGEILKLDFITGLNNPKGIAVINDLLYVSDVSELVVIDLIEEKIIKKHLGKNAEFLNDVAIASNGEVYVSEMFSSSVYKLDKQGDFKNWFSSPELENPNGLLIKGNVMFISAWGKFNDKKPINAPEGHFLKLNIKTKQIDKLSATPIGSLDGLQEYTKDSFLVSDWKKGTLLKVFNNGSSELFFKTERSVGDILYLPENKILALPINIKNKVLLYKVN